MEYYKNYRDFTSALLEAASTVEDVAKEQAYTIKKISDATKVPVLSKALAGTEYPEVKLLQAYLNAKGIVTGTDGKFGAKTAASVKQLQKQLSLTADGVAGLKTWTPLLKEFGIDASNFGSYKLTPTAAPSAADSPQTGSSSAASTAAALSIATGLKNKYAATLKRITDAKAIVPLTVEKGTTAIDDAKLVQDYFNGAKYGKLKVDGKYGLKSAKAAKKFQKVKGLTPDGKFGLNSWVALLKDFTIDATGFQGGGTAAPVAPGTPNPQILALVTQYADFFDYTTKNKQVPLLSTKIEKTTYKFVEMFQKYLTLKGFQVGAADGFFGATTKAGVIALQKQNKLTSDGLVGLKTWAIFFKDLNLDMSGYTLTNPKVPTADETPKAPLVATTVNADFYAYPANEKAAFEKMNFKYGGKDVTGAQLAAGNALKSVEICDVLKENPDPQPVKLLLKASKSLGANPTKLIITNAALTIEQLRPLLVLNVEQVDAELIYYGLRGSEDLKGHGTNLIVQRLLNARGNESWSYKEKLERAFYVVARAAKDTYSDTETYTLRKWLYEEYKDTDPVKWMNKLTKSNPQEDQKQFPALFPNQ